MNTNLSITKNNDREATIILSIENKSNPKLSGDGYDDYLRRKMQVLTDFAVSNDLILYLYKVKLQKIIVFNFKGKEENIEKLIKSFN